MSDTYGELEQQLGQLLKDHEQLKERHARLAKHNAAIAVAARAVRENASGSLIDKLRKALEDEDAN